MDFSRSFKSQNPRVHRERGGDQTRQYVQYQQQEYQQMVLGNKPIGSRVFQPHAIQQRQEQQKRQQHRKQQQQQQIATQKQLPTALKMSKSFQRSTTSPIASVRQTPAHGRKFGEKRNVTFAQNDSHQSEDFSYSWEDSRDSSSFQSEISQPWDQYQQPRYESFQQDENTNFSITEN